MHTTQEKILERLQRLPEGRLEEVLHFVDFLLSRPKQSIPFSQDQRLTFNEALRQFRAQVEVEGSDLEEIDFFADVRDRTPAPAEPRW